MKVLRILGVVFGAVGAALLVAAFITLRSARSFESTAVGASGEVIDLAPSYSDGSATHAPVVRFETPDGREVIFESSVSSHPPAYDIGERVDVLYAPDDPGDAVIDSFWQVYLAPVILGGIGSIFLLIGGGMLVSQIVARRRRERLMASGRRVTARIQGVDLNTSIAVNGRHPFCITSQWMNPDTGELHVFRSDGIWYDPSMHIDRETVDVLIDPANPKRYYVDTSFLPKVAGE